jgi:dCMP deaminase
VDEAVRPTFEEWASKLAKDISTRGECTRRKVGALIVTQDYRLVAAGYNGAPKGRPSCLDGACPRGQHYELYGWHPDHGSGTLLGCRCGGSWPCEQAVAPSSSYDTGKGSCIAVHAEVNAIGDAATRGCSIDGCRMFVSEPPCDGCVKVVQSTGLASLHAPGMDLVLR